MENKILILDKELTVKEYQGQRVITFKDMDMLHDRPDGTARRNFNANKRKFVKGEDYFDVNQPDEIRLLGITRPQGGTPASIILITESGYLMLVKSFTDDLAWKIQKQLVKNYFKVQQLNTKLTALQIIEQQAKALVDHEKRMLALEEQQKDNINKITDITNKVNNISGIVAISPTSEWKKECKAIISKIVDKRISGTEGYYMTKKNLFMDTYSSIYSNIDLRYGVNLSQRLKNKQQKLLNEGYSKEEIKEVRKLDIVSEDKKLIEAFVTIVKEFAIKYDISLVA